MQHAHMHAHVHTHAHAHTGTDTDTDMHVRTHAHTDSVCVSKITAVNNDNKNHLRVILAALFTLAHAQVAIAICTRLNGQ